MANLTPTISFLKDLVRKDADTQSVLAATRASDATTALNLEKIRQAQGLYPGQLLKQQSEIDLDYAQAEAQRAGAMAHFANVERARAEVDKFDAELEYYKKTEDDRLKLLQSESAERRASAAALAAQTKNSLADVDTKQRALFMQNYEMAAGYMSTITKLLKRGDIDGANRLYSGLKQRAAPAFIEANKEFFQPFEDGIDPKEAALIEDFNEYTQAMVLPDSTIAKRNEQLLQQQTQLETAKIQATNAGGVTLPALTSLRTQAEKVIGQDLASGLKINRSGNLNFNEDDEQLSSAASHAFTELKNIGTDIYTNTQGQANVATELGKFFSYKEIDSLEKPVVIPVGARITIGGKSIRADKDTSVTFEEMFNKTIESLGKDATEEDKEAAFKLAFTKLTSQIRQLYGQ